ncbi:hypothetical protein [Streptomyces sp. NPDC005046]
MPAVLQWGEQGVVLPILAGDRPAAPRTRRDDLGRRFGVGVSGSAAQHPFSAATRAHAVRTAAPSRMCRGKVRLTLAVAGRVRGTTGRGSMPRARSAA